jgi:hypothetical protein
MDPQHVSIPGKEKITEEDYTNVMDRSVQKPMSVIMLNSV